MLATEYIIEIFKALADPHRLTLFELLLTSDRTNSELMNLTDLSQNLLSHHLSVLTDCGLIRVQQSIGDARRRYFCPELDTVHEFYQWWCRYNPSAARPLPALKEPRQVLFLCQRNADRSLIAEALARHIAPGALIAYSAGIEALAKLPLLTSRILAEYNISVDGLVPKTYHELVHIHFDYVITVCDRVHEPPLPSEFTNAVHLHWSLHDPTEAAHDETGQWEAARRLYHQIEQRLAFFVQRLTAEES
jgi:arsenate reductase